MPRRKAVNPQPLKRPQEKSQVSKNKGEKKTRPFYSDNNTVETTRQTRSSLKRRYRKHKQASPITGPPRSKKKMTDTEATQPKSPPESDPTSQEVTSKEATGHQKMIVSETAPVCEVPSVDQAGDTGVQRNLSLEALFQVTHSELENISRQRPAVPPIVAPPSPIGPRLAAPVPHSIVIANSTNMKQKDSESGQEDEDVLHIVVSSDDGEAHLMPVTQQEAPEVTEMDITHADSCGVEDDANLQSIVKIPVSEKGVEKYQLKSDTLEEQGLKLIYTKKTFDQYEPNPISYGTYKPRSFKATSQVVDPNLQESGAVQVGRKRKHPQKPGRHICPYCGRGCAKPSVLQKHIRAHTGERPYPCIPCGFSFKTKSNLYKHCKSRAHAVKAGLTPNLEDATKIDGQSTEDAPDSEGEVEVSESGDSEGESLEEDTSVDSSGDARARSAIHQTASIEKKDLQASEETAKQMLLRLEQGGEDEMKTKTVRPGSVEGEATSKDVHGKGMDAVASTGSSVRAPVVTATKVYMTDRQYYDVAYVNSSGVMYKTVGNQRSLPPTATSVADIVHIETQSENAASPASLGTAVQQSGKERNDLRSLPSTEGLTPTALSSVQALPDKTMKVTIQLPKAVPGKTSMPQPKKWVVMHGTVSSDSGEPPPGISKVPARVKSLPRDPKAVTPEMLHDRITKLISANAAIIDTPMADAPRPKRLSRQNSEVTTLSRSDSVIQLQSGPLSRADSLAQLQSASLSRSDSMVQVPVSSGTVLQRAPVVESETNTSVGDVELVSSEEVIGNTGMSTPESKRIQIPLVRQNSQQQHGSIIMDTVAPESEERSEKSSGATVGGHSATVTSSVAQGPPSTMPQEIKIQIKLHKPKGGPVQPGTPTGNRSGHLQSATPIVGQPMIGQPGVQFIQAQLPKADSVSKTTQNPEGSVIKDLLLKGRTVQPPAVNTNIIRGMVPTSSQEEIQTVVLSPTLPTKEAEGPFIPGVREEVSGVRHVVIDGDVQMTPSVPVVLPHTSQEAGPLHIAQDVEVSSSIAASPHEHDTNVVESSQSGKKRKAPSESERIMGLSSITADVHESDSANTAELSQSKKQKSPSEQEWIIEPYDPNMPRKKGRPKGSKNRPKGAPHFGGAPITNLTPIAPNIQGDVNAGHVVGGPGSPRILLPHATPGGTSSQAASPLQPRPSLQLNIPRPIAPSFTPDFSSSIQSQTGSVMTSSPQTGTPQPDTPTTQSLWKLKLKGKLLMRRSMSQERMLSQEKVNTAGKIPNSPLTMQNRSHPLVQASPLVKSKGPIQRSESVEYPSLAKRPRLVESHSVDEAFNRTLHAHMAPELVVQGKDGSSGGALCKLVPTSQGSQNVSIRPNVEVKLSASGDACKKQSDSGISLAETVVVPSETTESETNLKRNPVTIPYNQCCVVLSNTEPLVSPLVNSKIPKSDRWIDVPPNISSRSPIAKQLSRLRSRMEAKAETQSSLDVKDESMSETVVEDSTKGKNFVGVGSHRPILKSQSMDDSKLSIREPRKPDVPVIEESPQESEQEGRILIGSVNENKTPAQQLVQSILQGHSRPSLDKNNIHATFCCVFRPQPMYVQQGNSQKISMYSNWRVARYNPNPQGLSSRMLLSLYKSRRYNSPHGMFASCDITEQKSGILTHSSYWNYYNKLQATKSDEVATVTESKFAKPEERDMYVIVTDGEQILTEPQSVMTISTDPNIQEQYKGTIISSNQPKRVRIFQGGFKSNEEYIYVRGRGRGKYVCEECGIRCKKPSMLKKHLRTHTDVRPFTCKHCNFSFKTKGNLTKHMKSKAHHKKCLELGVVPIPITVDESQIDAEALAKQTRISKEAKIFGEDSSLNLTDEEEEDEDMDEDGDEDDDDEDQPVIITETVSIPEEQEIRSQGHTVVAMATADGQQPEVIRIRVAPDGSQLVSESQHPSSLSTVYGIMQTATIVAEGSGGSAEGLSAEGKLPDDLDTRRAIDDEVARSLLDLSKQGQGNQPKLLRQHSAPAGALGPKVVASNPNRLDSLIGALMNRTNKGEADKSKGYQVHTIHPYSVGKDLSSIPVKKRLLRLSQGSEEKGEVYLVDCSSDTLDKVGHMTTPAGGSRMSTTLQAVTSQMSSKAVYKEVLPSDLGHSSRKSGATYAQKIAALQSANENDLRRSLGRSSISASSSTTSGFVPPILQGMLPVLVNPLGSTLSMSDEGGKSDKSASVEVRSVVSDKGTTGPTFQFTHPFQSTSVGLQSKDQGSQEIKIKDLLLVDSRGQSNSEHEEIREQTEGTRNAVPDENQEDQDQQKYSRSRSTSTDDRMSSGSKSPTSPTGSDGQGVMFTITSSGRIETVHGSTAGLATSQVQYVTGDNRAPYEIMPIPGKVREGADEMVDGKFVCNICRKSFTHQHQLVLHKNIHYFERQFRCEDCGISFRTKGHLVKHQRSESHHTKQNLKQHFGVATMENPRPFKCDDCKVAFRIHGHLAKHLRSKMHIATLERLGKVPPGTYAQIEKGDLTNIDATDCETSLESIQSMIDTANTGSLVQNIESDNVDDQDEPRSPMECDAGITIVSVSSLTGQTGTTSSDRLTAQATSPIREQFHLHSAGGYEKDDRASNERVTVEIKSEPIDLGDIYPSGSRQPHFGEEAEGEHVLSGRTADKSEGTNGRDEPQKSPHKCGMCGKTFKAMSSLKQHLVSHAELRPYVCEYCDAGFTTAQSLKFHLRTHTQERPYICGQCGDTFARSDHLKQHMRVHNRVPKSPGLQASSTTQVASRGPAPVSVSGASTLQRIPSHVDSTGAVKCSNVAGSQSQSMVVMLANQGGKVGENCMVPQETSDTHEQELPSLMATADGTNKKDTKSPSGEQQVYMILTEDGSLMELEASALSMEDQHKLGLLDDDASGGEGTQMMYVVMADDAEVSADSLQDIVQQVAALPGQPSTGQVLDQSAVEQVHVPQTVQCEGASHQPVQRQALIKPGAEQRLVRQQAVDQHTLPPQAIEQQGIDHLEIRQGNLEQQAAQQQSIEHQATEQDNMQHEAPKQQTIADAQHERLQHQARKQHSAGQAVDLGKLQFQEVKQQSTGYVSEKQQRLEPQNTEKESTDHTTPEEKQNQEAVQQSTSPQAMEKLSMQQQASGAESIKEERTGLAAQQGAVQMTTQQDNIGQVLEEMPMATKSFDAVEDTAEEKCRTADESAETVICTEHRIQTVNGGLKTQSLLVNQQAAIVEIESPDIVVNMEQGGDTGDIHVQGQKPSAEESVEAEDVTLEVSKSEGGVNMEGASNKEEHVDTNYQHEAHCDINFKNVHRFGCAGSVDGNVDPTKGTDKSTESDSKTPRLNNEGTELPGAESADQQVLPSSGKNNGLDEVCTGAGLCVNIESSEKTANTQINSASDPSQVQVKDNTQDLENTKGAENLVMGTNVSGEKNRSQREAGEEDHGKRMQNFTEEMEVDSVGQMTQEVLPVMVQNMQSDQEDSRSVEVMECNTAEATTAALTESTNQQVSDHGDVTMETSHVEYKSPASNDSFELVLEDLSEDDPS